MPIYEYQCEQCGERFDKFVRSMFTEAEVVCPSCESTQVRKGFSTFASRGDTVTASVSSASNCAPTG